MVIKMDIIKNTMIGIVKYFLNKNYYNLDGNRSNSASRGANGFGNGYESHIYPIAYEQHNSSSRRSGGGSDFERASHFSSHNHRSSSNGGGLAHARYGSLSDSLRRGELKYIPNGDVREGGTQNGKRFHKSYSTRDVFNDQYYGGNGGHNGSYYPQQAPVVEFPPTLPRGGRYGGFGDAPMPPPHRENGLTKSRSYADWDEGRGPFGSNIRRFLNKI